MSPIPDFTETELWTVRTTLKERYDQDIDIELADAEIRLDPSSRTLTECPTIFWTARNANFVVFKISDSRYRCQFYYRGFQQYGTGNEIFDNIGQCVTVLLQVQADHERKEAGTK
ncbi:MAG: hypothetical protein OEY67_07910 [Gammaproteobacteria bacterium]|nr:hypothetical protein [Gammaproteobacteria bacterium]